MTTYVAMLRGIAPTDPRMRNANLRAVCRELGLRDVRTVISSGNVVFEAEPDSASTLEAALEAAWRERLGFTSTTIIRSRQRLEDLVAVDPFGALEHGPRSYLLATFAKQPLNVDFDVPFALAGIASEVVGATERELFTVTDQAAPGSNDIMRWIERRFGAGLTSRTWLTVGRILKRMG